MKVITLIVLETSTLLKRLRKDKEVIRKLKRFTAAELATTSISVYELYLGAYIGEHDRARKITEINELINSLKILDFDQESAKQSTIIQSKLVERKIIKENQWLADLLS
jgi:predicted nucleic acid-binding protein